MTDGTALAAARLLGNQPAAKVNQPQRQIRLPGAGRAAQQDAGAVNSDARGMDLFHDRITQPAAAAR